MYRSGYGLGFKIHMYRICERCKQSFCVDIPTSFVKDVQQSLLRLCQDFTIEICDGAPLIESAVNVTESDL